MDLGSPISVLIRFLFAVHIFLCICVIKCVSLAHFTTVFIDKQISSLVHHPLASVLLLDDLNIPLYASLSFCSSLRIPSLHSCLCFAIKDATNKQERKVMEKNTDKNNAFKQYLCFYTA